MAGLGVQVRLYKFYQIWSQNILSLSDFREQEQRQERRRRERSEETRERHVDGGEGELDH